MEEPFEERYRDVLFSMENVLMPLYNKYAKMTDHSVIYAIETLIKSLNAEAQGRTVALPEFQPHEQDAFNSLRAISYWLMGQGQMTDEKGREIEREIGPKSREEIIECLKRIHKSAQFWLKRGGRRGYFEYVSQYLSS
ncbi:MAG: hypothetical protein J2P31_18405 [Blastocatellia bacterium]|nr:hypothetical protein [Blastocatellia bacterium]